MLPLKERSEIRVGNLRPAAWRVSSRRLRSLKTNPIIPTLDHVSLLTLNFLMRWPQNDTGYRNRQAAPSDGAQRHREDCKHSLTDIRAHNTNVKIVCLGLGQHGPFEKDGHNLSAEVFFIESASATEPVPPCATPKHCPSRDHKEQQQ
jgi:hypothetical protein